MWNIKPSIYTKKNYRQYGLFTKSIINGKPFYNRIFPQVSFRKPDAILCFQPLILNGMNQNEYREIRPIK